MVTGASGGLGRAIATELAGRGASLVLTARTRDALEELAGATCGEVVVADLSERGDVRRLCGMLGDIDVLVANAGVGGGGALVESTEDEIDFALDVNLRAPMVMATEFAQQRAALGRSGQMVMIGSLSGMVATPNTRLYNATKFGLRGFTLALRQDAAELGIGVTLVAPGFIDTAGMFAENNTSVPGFVRTKSPDDVAAAVVKAIESNPPEVYVAPVELRASATVGTIAPWLSEAIQRRLGTAEMTRDL